MKENNTKFSRRNFLQYLAWTATLGTMAGATVGSARFMFPNILYEPPKSYKIGRPQDYLEGVTFLPDKRFMWSITLANLRLYQPYARTSGVHPTG